MFSAKILFKNYIKQSINYFNLRSNSRPLQTLINNNNDCIESSQELTSNVGLICDEFKSLAINKRIEAKIKIIVCEYELLKTSCPERVPKKISINDMKELLKCWKMKKRKRIWIDHSFRLRAHLLSFLNKLESFDGLNRLVIPIMPFEKEKFYSNRLKIAALFGQNVVIDLSFDKYMSTLECKNCAEQLWRIYYYNRTQVLKRISPNEIPFNLNFVNINNNERTKQFMDRLYPEFYERDSYINITSKSYLDLFPKENLIYLSPHAEDVMTDYDPNAVFIIGGIVDRQKVINLSHEKAKQENIRSLRLPLDDMMKKHNIQSLDDVIRVLHDLKYLSSLNKQIDWQKTLRQQLPHYKLKSEAQMAYEMLKKQGIDFVDYEDDDEDYDSDESIDLNCK